MTSLYNLGGKGRENMPSLSVWLPAAVGNPTEAQLSILWMEVQAMMRRQKQTFGRVLADLGWFY